MSDPAPHTPVTQHRRRGLGLATLLSLTWAIGTPVLGWGAMIASAPFFGEQPTAAEMATSQRLLAGAIACGFGAPLAGIGLALRWRNRAMTWWFVALLALVSAGVGTLAVATAAGGA